MHVFTKFHSFGRCNQQPCPIDRINRGTLSEMYVYHTNKSLQISLQLPYTNNDYERLYENGF